MKLNEIFTELQEAEMAWGRKGNKIVRRFRCTSGKRAGRLVDSPADCDAPIDLKKRQQMKKTEAAKGARMARKAQRTKRVNPASIRVQRLNQMGA